MTRKNPLRWSSWKTLDATIRDLKQEEQRYKQPEVHMQQSSQKYRSSEGRGGSTGRHKIRPVEVRLRGEKHIYPFDSAGEAWRWLDETQGDGSATETHWWQDLLERVRSFLRVQKLTYVSLESDQHQCSAILHSHFKRLWLD